MDQQTGNLISRVSFPESGTVNNKGSHQINLQECVIFSKFEKGHFPFISG